MSVLNEVVEVAALDGSIAVHVLALNLFERITFGGTPGAVIDGHNWAMIWLLCTNIAAKVQYDVRARSRAPVRLAMMLS